MAANLCISPGKIRIVFSLLQLNFAHAQVSEGCVSQEIEILFINFLPLIWLVMAEDKRKLTCLTFDQKLTILNLLKANDKTRKDIAKEFNCNVSTISRIVKEEEKIKEMALENGNTSRKRIRRGNYDEIDQAVSMWFKQMRAKDAVISGPMIMEKAKDFSKLLGIENFEPNNGWLGRWKNKENVSFHRMHGEQSAADKEGANDWIKNILPNLIKNYKEIDIYNADESGLFYKALPNGTLASKGEKVEGGKVQKDRLTLLFICNMDGSDKHIFCIGRSKNPICFRGKSVPLPYYANRKSWMTCELWNKILIDFNKTLEKQKRNIILFVDNAQPHKLECGITLKNISLQFLPPNTTSVIQPLDQGIIRAFKAYYRQQIIRRQLLFLENEQPVSKFTKTIDVLEALNMIKHSWELVTPTTIRNCFRKAGFHHPSENVQLLLSENENLVINLDAISEEAFHDYVKIDDDLICYGEMSNEEIVSEVKNSQETNSADSTHEIEEECGIIKNSITRKEAASALMTLTDFFKENNLDLKNINALSNQFFDLSKNKKQTKLTDFF